MPELAPLLLRLDFDEPYWQGTNTALVDSDYGQLIESWSGYALVRSGPKLKPFVVPAVQAGRANVAAGFGALRLWFKPNWTSASLPGGNGAGADAVLAEMIVLDQKGALTAWSLRFSADGSTLLLIGEGGTVELLRAGIALRADEWHCIALNYGPQETGLFLDGQLISKGAGVTGVPAPASGVALGSTALGSNAAEGDLDEVCFLGWPLSEAAVEFHFQAYGPMAARGAISPEEEAARQEAMAKRKAVQKQPSEEGGSQMLRIVGGTSQCITNVPVYLTNIVSVFITNQGWTVTFDIQGGPNGPLYDIFATTNLSGSSITNSQWTWLERGPTCSTYQYTNQPAASAFYVLGTPQDSDSDGLTDAYEQLVSKTATNSFSSPDTDGDGMPDAWEFLNGLNPQENDATGDADADGISNLQEYLNEQTLLRPREPLGPCSRRTPLVISEILYNQIGALGLNEFIEIHNTHHLPQNISGFSLDQSVTFTFPANTIIPPGGFLIVVGNMSHYPSVANRVGPYANSLPNNAVGRVRLLNQSGAVLLDVEYQCDPPWPAAADGTGHTLVLARPSYGEGDYRAWAASVRIGGTPGTNETGEFDPLAAIRINEFLAATNAASGPEFIELYNQSSTPVDISGTLLSPTGSNLGRFTNGPGTVVPARGFLRLLQGTNAGQFPFTLNDTGDAIYLTNPQRTKVIDAVNFKQQANGIATGRFPDGAPGFQELAAQSAASTNAPPLARNLVINEIMFHPIAGGDAGEYVELYNRAPTNQSLSGWSLAGGISYSFTSGSIAPSNYVVVTKNTNNLAARYTNLVLGVNLFGNFNSSLGNGGDRVQLLSNNVVVDEVTYGDGGRWGQWADGGGSSLELIDPRADNRLAANWGDSDETSKSAWTTISFIGILDQGMSNAPIGGNFTNVIIADSLEITLQGAGECLLDDVKALDVTNANHVSNSTFETNGTGWEFQGTHDLSSLETNSGYNSSRSLHLRASGRGGTGGNRIRTVFDTVRNPGATNTISAQARWLRGETNIVLRLHGNWLEAAGTLPVPTNLGSPGLVNSRHLTNSGPAIYDVGHSPVLPAAGQVVLVTARLHDPDGVTNLVLRYRIDPTTNLTAVPMNDAGTNGDALAGDGLFTAKIPGQTVGKLAAFRIDSTDGLGAASRFPANRVVYPGDTENCECLVRFGETKASGTFDSYRMWMTAATATQWANRLILHNSPLDITFVYNDSRVIYNAGALYSGSPATSLPSYGGPTGSFCGYELAFPGDDRFMGGTDAVLDWPIRDNTGQREQVAYWMAEQMGMRPNYRRFVHLVVNGVAASSRGLGGQDGTQVYEDTQQPGSDFLDEWFSEQSDGELHKFDQWVEYSPASNFYNRSNIVEPIFDSYTTTNNFKKLAKYRWLYPKRTGSAQAHNYESLYALVDALNTNASYTASVNAILNAEQWMRVWAFEDVMVNGDSFGNGVGGKNMFMYRPATNDLWQLLLWDLDVGMGEANSALLGTNDYPLLNGPDASYPYTSDGINYRLNTNAPFLRAYWRALQDAVNGPLQSASYSAVLNGNYAALTNNGVSVKRPDEAVTTNYSLVAWIDKRRNYLNSQLASVPTTTFAITSNGGQNYSVTNQSGTTILGTAPLEVAFLRVNGATTNANVTWTSVTNWSLGVALSAPLSTNLITVRGYDWLNQMLGTNPYQKSITITNKSP